MNGDSSSVQIPLAHFQSSRDSSTDSGEEEDVKDEREALLVEDEDSVELQFLAEEDRQYELIAAGGSVGVVSRGLSGVGTSTVSTIETGFH